MRASRLAFVLALVVAALWIVLPIGRGGAWDPYELDVADLARRIAVHAFGATDLARAGDPATIPTLTDLGMGELPFTWMALVFRWFGVSDVTGRGAMAVWAVVGAAALGALVRRASGERTSFWAVAVLVTMPLYLLQGRTMLGDIVTIASFAIAVSGMLLWAIIPGRARWAAAAVGAAGLAAGFMSRGWLLGVAAPCVSVGVAMLVGGELLGGSAASARIRRIVGTVLVALGALAAVRFCVVALPLVDTDAPLAREAGMILWDSRPNDATFDRLLRQIGHGLFPWSALLPWALSRAFSTRETGPEAFVRIALAVASIVAFACGTLVVPWAGALPYVGVVPLAGLVALALADLDRGQRPSPVAALGVGAAYALLVIDLTREPVRTLAAFGLVSPTLPPAYDEPAKRAVVVAGLLSAPIVIVALAKSEATLRLTFREVLPFLAARVREARTDARALGRAAVAAFQGNLLFFLVVFEAGLVGLAAMLFIGGRAEWESVTSLPHAAVRAGQAAWWALPLAALGAAVAWRAGAAAVDAAAAVTRLGRGGVVGLAVAMGGTWLSFGYYPALAAELSPKEVFETFRAKRAPGEELALLGASPRSGAFYAGQTVPSFSDERSAFDWLDAAGDNRRFLVVKARDLARLNSLWRGEHQANLPVIDARRSENLLAVSRLGDEPNQNPLGDIVLDADPTPAKPLATRFLDDLDVLGWEVRDERGRLVDAVVPGKPFKLVFYYRVLARVGDWQAFVHLDGRSRQNADHAVLGGRYPMPLWQPGDRVRDEIDVTLPPNFGPGEIWVFFGFFQGKTRMRVTEGEHQEDRAIAGRIKVR
jgi:hypothetical protein